MRQWRLVVGLLLLAGVVVLVNHATPQNGGIIGGGGGGTGTEYAADTLSTAGDKITMAGVIRQDTPTSLVDATGDRTLMQVDSLGRAWVNADMICDPLSTSSVAVAVSAAGNTELVALTSGQTIYVCDVTLVATVANDVQLVYGTGTACATGETDMAGPVALDAKGGWTHDYKGRLKTAPANALCLELSGATAVNGVITYRKVVSPLPTGDWPNEPAGYTVVTDYAFNDTIPTGQGVVVGDGWSINNANGYATKVTDAGGPFSPSNIGQWRYPIGFPDGQAPATLYHSLPSPTELYVGYWWKPSSSWQHHSSTDKIVFPILNSNPVFMNMSPPTGSLGRNLRTVLSFSSGDNTHLPFSSGSGSVRNLDGSASPPTITLGQWHRIEIYLKRSTTLTSQNGIVRWWLNGTLVGDYTTVNWPTDAWVETQISPTFGGFVGETKTQEDFYYYDHVRVSVP